MIASIKPSAMRPELVQKIQELRELVRNAYPEVNNLQFTINNVQSNIMRDADVTLQVQI